MNETLTHKAPKRMARKLTLHLRSLAFESERGTFSAFRLSPPARTFDVRDVDCARPPCHVERGEAINRRSMHVACYSRLGKCRRRIKCSAGDRRPSFCGLLRSEHGSKYTLRTCMQCDFMSIYCLSKQRIDKEHRRV